MESGVAVGNNFVVWTYVHLIQNKTVSPITQSFTAAAHYTHITVKV
jgi:hypothetical protein